MYAEFGHGFSIGGYRHKMPRNRTFISAEGFQRPDPRRVRVCHRFQRGKGLRANDKERLGWIQSANRFDEVRSINIRDEPKRQHWIAVMLQSLVSHDRAEVRTTDADIDDVSNALTGMPKPRAGPDGL